MVGMTETRGEAIDQGLDLETEMLGIELVRNGGIKKMGERLQGLRMFWDVLLFGWGRKSTCFYLILKFFFHHVFSPSFYEL